MIRIENLTYIYLAGTPYEKKALDSVSLHIEKNSFTGIIGSTGSGKSTLVQHLNGLLKPASGTVTVDGEDVSGKNLKELRRNVGLVFQYPEHQLFEETVYKDIAFGLTKQGWSEEEIRDKVMAALRAVDIDESLLDKSPFEISGGQKRRVAIAGVIAMKPKVLVLDEPAAGLDPKGREDIYRMVGAMHEAGDMTVILVSHNMEDVARHAQRVVVLHKGRLEMQGTPGEVFMQHDRLTGMGLDVPQITRVMLHLKTLFPDLSSETLTVEDAKDAILKYIGINLWKEGSRFR
ncbi:MAG TPA: energy-coupling factor transporter ATPase [Clostridiales bacterium]|nr:energy-coupling factor transporter ATPase [Clostridiales bacterium]